MAKCLLFVVNDAEFFLSHRSNLARAAQHAGWSVHVAVPADALAARIRNEGFVFHSLPLSRSGMNPFSELQTVWSLFWLFRRLRPNVVHAVTIKPVLYSGLLAPFAGIPLLVQAVSGLGHVFIDGGFGSGVRRAFVGFAYRFAFRHPGSRVIFQNPDDKMALKGALRKGQAVLIPGAGVDPEEFKAYLEPEGIPLVVLASRMLWAKGVGEFVEAARVLRARGIRARFALVGDSDPHNPAAVPQHQLTAWAEMDAVEWWGRQEDMPSVFKQAAVVCLPTYYGEGIPKVLIEAASAAKPIVATDWPGCREIVHHGDNGLLVRPRDAEALADALQKLIGSADLRAAMGARGRERVLDGFTSEQVVRETLRIYGLEESKGDVDLSQLPGRRSSERS